MPYNTMASAFAIGLTFAAFFPYLRGILLGRTRPHVFSWVIWSSTTFLVFLAQRQARGGVGAWPIGLSGVMTLLVAILAAYKRGDLAVTRADWAFLLAAFSALPLWFFTRNAFWAVLVLTTVDLLGFGPTLCKAWKHPREESHGLFALFALRNALVIIALESRNPTTVTFPATIGIACLFVNVVLFLRRQRSS